MLLQIPSVCQTQAFKTQPLFCDAGVLPLFCNPPQSRPLFWALRPPEELLKKLPEWFRPKTKRNKNYTSIDPR